MLKLAFDNDFARTGMLKKSMNSHLIGHKKDCFPLIITDKVSFAL